MRAFLGLEPDVSTKLAIDNWRTTSLPPYPTAVPAANFHVTLAFLGNINLEQQDKLQQQIAVMEDISEFSVNLDIAGYWAKPKAFWIGCSNHASAHLQLVKKLTTAAHSADIATQKNAYQAHVTLIRKCTENPPAPLVTPNFTWRSQAFHLYESLSTAKGVVYAIRQSWPLMPELAVRKRI
ncbi:MAG: RNA 2',3'-cyclic phosphodiesterase [Paraglaciecola sp.]|nr:RNA 2',3'-cyclic phosphodiesterase [Paraglaciecola sp.]